MRTLSMSRWYVDSYGCERLDAVLGVPAVKRRTDDTVILFTGRSLVSLEAWGSENPLESELALARRLRPPGESEAGDHPAGADPPHSQVSGQTLRRVTHRPGRLSPRPLRQRPGPPEAPRPGVLHGSGR